MTVSSVPAAISSSHSAGSEGWRGAVPPKPVLTPPIGIIPLPTASVSASTFSPEELSSTTMVCTESGCSSTVVAVCSPGAANCTVRVPGETAM